MSLYPGQIYLADFGGSVSRPIVIVSREELNRGKYVVAVPFTSTNYDTRSKQRNCVSFKSGEFGLTKDCVAQTESITFIEVNALDFDTGVLGKLDDESIRNLTRAIGYVISAECEPD